MDSSQFYQEVDFDEKYDSVIKIGCGSFSEVVKCRHKVTREFFACKQLIRTFSSLVQVFKLSEVKTLVELPHHPNILRLVGVHLNSICGRTCLVFDLMDTDLFKLIQDRPRELPEPRVRLILVQILRGLCHLHKNGIFHRDMKPENVLLKNVEGRDYITLGDFGSVQGIGASPPYTQYISTRWYRSPECILTAGYYGPKMDIWATGCIFYEVLTLTPLFDGTTEIDQINRIHDLLGAPSAHVLSKFFKLYDQFDQKKVENDPPNKVRLANIKAMLSGKSKNFAWYAAPKDFPHGFKVLLPDMTHTCKDILKRMLEYDPDNRPSAESLLNHEYLIGLKEETFGLVKPKKIFPRTSSACAPTGTSSGSATSSLRAATAGCTCTLSRSSTPSSLMNREEHLGCLPAKKKTVRFAPHPPSMSPAKLFGPKPILDVNDNVNQTSRQYTLDSIMMSGHNRIVDGLDNSNANTITVGKKKKTHTTSKTVRSPVQDLMIQNIASGSSTESVLGASSTMSGESHTSAISGSDSDANSVLESGSEAGTNEVLVSDSVHSNSNSNTRVTPVPSSQLFKLNVQELKFGRRDSMNLNRSTTPIAIPATMTRRAVRTCELLYKSRFVEDNENDPPSDYPSLVKFELHQEAASKKANQSPSGNCMENASKLRNCADDNEKPSSSSGYRARKPPGTSVPPRKSNLASYKRESQPQGRSGTQGKSSPPLTRWRKK